MTKLRAQTSWAIAILFALAAAPAVADEPFSGTWSPTCKPTAAQEVDNQLATIVIFKGAAKFADMECEIAGWEKKGSGYASPMTCFKKGSGALKRRIVVRQLKDKMRVAVSGDVYDRIVERCGN